jgi:hypothetical protein
MAFERTLLQDLVMTKSAVGISFGLFLLASAGLSASRASADEGLVQPAALPVALEQGASAPAGERMIHDPLVRGASSDAADLAEGTWEEQSAGCTDPNCGHGVNGCGACVPAALPVYVPCLPAGWQYSAGLLLLTPGADNLGYATITTFLPLQNPQWDVQALDPNAQPGLMVGARYNLASPGKDIQTSWEHLRAGASSSVAVSDLDTQWISPFSQTGPSTSESSNEVGIFHLKSAKGEVNFDYDMANIDAGQTVNIGSGTQVRLFAGVSIVRLKEQLVSTFYNDPSVVPVPPVIAIPDPNLQYITLNNTSTYTGAGPRLGLSTAYNITGGLTFVGQMSGAILQGRMQPAQYTFQGVFNGAVDAEQIRSDSVTQVVYASDAKVGLGYTRPLGRSVLEIESGFKAAVFVDAFSTYETSTNVLPLDIGSLSTNSMRHTPSNFTLGGFYASGSVRW